MNEKHADETDKLIIAYKECNDEKKKRMLHLSIVENGMNLVKKIAGSISAQSGISNEDLVQVGSIGLIKAIEFFNPDKNARFKTYATYFIRGEIKHYLRDKASIIKAPRELQELVFKISSAVKQLKEKGFEEPSEEQIADIAGVSAEKIHEVMEIELCKTTLSLDQAISSVDDDDLTLIDKIPSGDYQEFMNSYENKIMLAEAIKKLPEDMQEIIKMSYYEGLNQREISEKINISQMQVSRRLKKALSKMYEIIKKRLKETKMGALIAVLALVFVTGLCIGSFLNVVILRTLSEESIVFPASKCPKCQTPLKWWHNIPVLSYIFLRGKCAFCKEHISIQYPIIELLTGIIYTLLFMKFGLSFDTLFAWIFAALLIVIAGTDIKEKVVYDVHTYTLIGTGLIYALVVTATAFWQVHTAGAPLEFTKYVLLNNPLSISILGLICGAAILEICARAGYLVAGTRAFGEGDTLIAAGLGAIFGWRTLLVVLVLSVVIQVILFLPIFVKGLIQNKEFKTLASFSIFCLFAIVFYSLQHFRVITIDDIVIYSICAAILAVLGIISCLLIFKGLRENPENRTYLPFGPAMVAGAFIALIL